jgi:hypothetical protein
VLGVLDRWVTREKMKHLLDLFVNVKYREREKQIRSDYCGTCLVLVKDVVYMFSFGDTCPGLLKKAAKPKSSKSPL